MLQTHHEPEKMADLQLRILGDLEVIRGDTVLALPPSRKTRGLLAYLALQDKPLRREQLCELLWEIPDDPRGSLRWSLSKIRKLVDEEHCSRIIADRSTVTFDTSSVDVDVQSLHRSAQSVETASVDELVKMAEQNQGAFLEGLDMPDFHDYHAWCIGERARTVRSQAAVLGELGRRLADEPDRALDYAISLVSLTPFDESPRAELIRLLVQLDRQQEAEHQYQVGKEKLAEVGAQETGALGKAMR
jgi:DNA-binding SARP family transcriptional activator